jgi:hypothetical protein
MNLAIPKRCFGYGEMKSSKVSATEKMIVKTYPIIVGKSRSNDRRIKNDSPQGNTVGFHPKSSLKKEKQILVEFLFDICKHRLFFCQICVYCIQPYFMI